MLNVITCVAASECQVKAAYVRARVGRKSEPLAAKRGQANVLHELVRRQVLGVVAKPQWIRMASTDQGLAHVDEGMT